MTKPAELAARIAAEAFADMADRAVEWAKVSDYVDRSLQAFDRGDLAVARNAAMSACDLEFDLMGDTLVTNDLAELVGVTEQDEEHHADARDAAAEDPDAERAARLRQALEKAGRSPEEIERALQLLEGSHG